MMSAPRARAAANKVTRYREMLRPLMEFILQQTFPPEYEFSRAELLEVTPTGLMRFLKLKVFGNEEANIDTDQIINYRSNTIKCWKKAWSYFMPNKLMTWDEVTGRGNPTRCTEINQLIRVMIRKEVGRLGMPSQARRSFIAREFEKLIVQFGRHNDLRAVWLASYFCFQFNMMARLDDTAKFRRPDLQAWNAYPEFGVTAKL